MPTPATPSHQLASFYATLCTLTRTSQVSFRRPRYTHKNELTDQTVNMVVNDAVHAFPLSIQGRCHDGGRSQTHAVFQLCQIMNLLLMQRGFKIELVRATNIGDSPLLYLNRVLSGEMELHELSNDQEREFYYWAEITCQVTEL